MNRNVVARLFLAFAALGIGAISEAHAAPATPLTGTIAGDDTVLTFLFGTSTTQLYNFYTTSYAGGLNLNGTRSAGGGFDPLLTLFSLSTGKVVGTGGGNSICGAGGIADAATKLCNDANFTSLLGPGNYELALTEFPNGAAGNLSDGFLFSGDPTLTGDLFCGKPGVSFLESDVAPCVQRNSSYSVNFGAVATVTPEPASWLLVLPGIGGVLLVQRRQLA